MKSWKTTVCGILALVIAVATAAKALLDGDPNTVPNWEIVAGSVMAAIGLFVARDNDVTSEDAGVK